MEEVLFYSHTWQLARNSQKSALSCCCIHYGATKWLLRIPASSRKSYSIVTLLSERDPPPPGGFSIYYVPWSRAVCKRFHDEMRRSHLVVKSLIHGSWSGNIVNRNPPRGGGVLSIKVAEGSCAVTLHLPPRCLQVCVSVCLRVCVYVCLCVWVRV